jgi:hypothetical protein
MPPRNTQPDDADGGAPAPAGGERYPVLGQVRAAPGLFAGTIGAMVAFLAALLLPGAVPAASTTAALVVASPIAGLALGIGVGWDREVPRRLAQRLQPAGFALLILPFATGLAAGPEPMGQAWISVASLAHALTGVTIGRQLSERRAQAADRDGSPS